MSDNPATPARTASPAMAISHHMVRLMATYVGRGPTNARTTLSADMALVTCGQTMSRSEHNLVGAGEAYAVRAMRQVFHRSMREEAVVAGQRTHM